MDDEGSKPQESLKQERGQFLEIHFACRPHDEKQIDNAPDAQSSTGEEFCYA